MKKIERNIKKHLLFLCFKYNIGLLWGVSSAGLERLPVTQKVEGSSPLHPATIFLPPQIRRLIKVWPHRLMVRTPPFQGENPGSNPSGAAKNLNTALSGVFCWFSNNRTSSKVRG